MRALVALLCLLFLSFSSAQSVVTFDSSNTITACRPSIIKWSGGKAPYNVSILSFAAEVDSPLAYAPCQDGVMLVVIPKGGSPNLYVSVMSNDSTVAQQQNITVIQPSDPQDKCLQNTDSSVFLSDLAGLVPQPASQSDAPSSSMIMPPSNSSTSTPTPTPSTPVSVTKARLTRAIAGGIATVFGILILAGLMLWVHSYRRQKQREAAYATSKAYASYASMDTKMPRVPPRARERSQAASTVLDVPDARGLRLGRLIWNPANSRRNSGANAGLPLPISSSVGSSSGLGREVGSPTVGSEMVVSPADTRSSRFGWRRSQMSEFRQAIERAYQWVKNEEGLGGGLKRTLSRKSTRSASARSIMSSLRMGGSSPTDVEPPPVPLISEKFRSEEKSEITS